MSNLNKIKSDLTNNKKSLIKKYHLKSIAIFGSHSRGEENLQSDVDILVEFEKPIGLEFVSLAEELEKILGEKVDLVSKGAIKPKLWRFIEKDLVHV